MIERRIDVLAAQYALASEPKAEAHIATKKPLPPVVTDGVHRSVKAAHSATRKWAADIIHKRTSPYWLTLYGDCGCGKTLLATHAREFLRGIGARVEFRNWPRVLESIYNKDEGLLHQMKSAPILILDDVGAEYTASPKTAQFSAAKLYLLSEARQGKWTFITTNLDYNGLRTEIGKRFASRIYRNNAVVVDMSGAEDYSYKLWLNNKTTN